MSIKGKKYPTKVSCGPIEPFNERLRLKQLISDQLRATVKYDNHRTHADA